VSTSEARAALPRTVPHGVAVAGLGRLMALTRGLAEGDSELIRIGFEDELHVPYRMPLIVSAQEAVQAACDAGAWAVTVSGSGSGLLAACPPEVEDAVVRAMLEVFAGEGDGSGCVGFALTPDMEGLRRL
jgi:homoserine kinase